MDWQTDRRQYRIRLAAEALKASAYSIPACSQILETTQSFFSSLRNPRIKLSSPHQWILDGFGHNLSLTSISSSSSGTTKDESGDQRLSGPSPSAVSSWIDQYLPAMVRSYALLVNLDKPMGTWLLTWP